MGIFADLTHDEARHLADFHKQYGAVEAPAVTLREQSETAQQAAEYAKAEFGDTSAEYVQAALLALALGTLSKRLATRERSSRMTAGVEGVR